MSNWSDLLTSALFKIGLEFNTFAMKVNDFVAPTTIVWVVPVSVPKVLIRSDEDTNSKPTGNTSFTSTLVAISGPALVTFIV